VAGFNLALVMRSLLGIGKPRRLQDGLATAVLGVVDSVLSLLKAIRSLRESLERLGRILATPEPEIHLPTTA